MIIKTAKDLERLIKLCKKQGITSIRVGNVEFNVKEQHKSIQPIDADAFPEASIKIPAFNGLQASLEPDVIKTDELTEDQLLNWSVKPEPGSEEQEQ